MRTARLSFRQVYNAAAALKKVKSPRNIEPNEVVPFTHGEERRILEAGDQTGRASYKRVDSVYERRRARAMVLLLRHTALRISGACTLKKHAISGETENSVWRIFVRTQNSGEPDVVNY